MGKKIINVYFFTHIYFGMKNFAWGFQAMQTAQIILNYNTHALLKLSSIYTNECHLI